MKVAIIGAMEEEVAILRERLVGALPLSLGCFDAYTGQYAQHALCLLRSGIGKVSAAVSTTLLLEAFAPQLVINIGTAGALSPKIAVGDVVVAESLRYWDVDASHFGYKPGQVPMLPQDYMPDREWLARARQLQPQGFACHFGVITAGDSFIGSETQLAAVRAACPGALAVDMESCAIAQTCYLYHVPFVILRGISDHACSNALVDHQVNFHLSSLHSTDAVLSLLVSA